MTNSELSGTSAVDVENRMNKLNAAIDQLVSAEFRVEELLTVDDRLAKAKSSSSIAGLRTHRFRAMRMPSV